VTTANSFEDNLKMLKLIKEFTKTKIVAFTMGEKGKISRILSSLAGGYFTYGCLEEGLETASGQLSVIELNRIYKYLKSGNRMLSGKSIVCGILGDPIEHSLSPTIHNAAFESANLDYIYVPFKVKKEDLRQAIEGIRALNIRGLVSRYLTRLMLCLYWMRLIL